MYPSVRDKIDDSDYTIGDSYELTKAINYQTPF